MKIKNIYGLIIIMLHLFFASCIEDKGNYDYVDEEDIISITISNLEDEVVAFRKLTLSPSLENLDPTREYSYKWLYWPVMHSHTFSRAKVLATTKDIDADISMLPPMEYYVAFEVRDVERDLFIRKRIKMSIELTKIQQGWYVLKDKDGFTDFDYISKEDIMYENVLKDHTTAGNMQLKGKAKRFTSQEATYTHQVIIDGKVDTTLMNQKVFHIITDQEYSVFNMATLERFKQFGNSFFETPSLVSPQAVEHCMNALYFLNGGKIYGLSSITWNVGLYGVAPVETEEYLLADTFIPAMAYALVFDKKTRTFKKYEAYSSTMSSFTPPKDPKRPSATNMDADLVEMIPANVKANGSAGAMMMSTGVALMKNINKDEHYFLKLELNNLSLFNRIDTLKNSKHPVLTSPLRAATRAGHHIYYTNAESNELWAYDYAEKVTVREQRILAVPAGEKITSVQEVFIHRDIKVNYVAITTSLPGDKWKMYHYQLISTGNPGLTTEPLKVYTGEGTARYVLYRP